MEPDDVFTLHGILEPYILAHSRMKAKEFEDAAKRVYQQMYEESLVTDEALLEMAEVSGKEPNRFFISQEALEPLRGGHPSSCPYRGNSDFACTCQPPTLYGSVLLWHCGCCNLPLALLKYGLCDMCESHQYSSPTQARDDHENALHG